MCCEPSEHRGGRHRGWHHKGRRHGCGCGCGCGEHAGFGRRFWTREEKRAWLEEYLKDLRAEAKAVEERIAALENEE